MPTKTCDVVVVGGGVVGLASAFRLAQDGIGVTVVDTSGGAGGASWVAAGMLAPVSEAGFGEQDMVSLNIAAVGDFIALAAALDALPGESLGVRTDGTLAVAFNADDRAILTRLTVYRDSLGLTTQTLTGTEVREAEPYLAAQVRSGVLAPEDFSVDNRRYVRSLQRATSALGVRRITGTVTSLTRGNGRVTGVLTEAGETITGSTVVVCAGAQTGRLLDCPIRPVKGQILRLAVPDRLRAAGPVLTRTVRGIVRGHEIYLVPRADGEVVVGATTEQQGFDVSVTAGGVYELLRSAYELLPVSAEFTFVEARAGLRPGTPDNGPSLGFVEPGLLLAGGHYRNGVLLSAATGQAVAALIAGRTVAPQWSPFHPNRFTEIGHAGTRKDIRCS